MLAQSVQAIIYLGLSTQLSNNTFCIGEMAVYDCTVNSDSHVWRIPAFGVTETVSRVDPNPQSDLRFTFRLVEDNGTSISSSLSVVFFAELNGTGISCSDASQPMGQGETQETLAMAFSKYIT